MTFADIKDKVRERWNDFASRVSENETVVSFVERFNNLSPTMQKVLTAAFVLLVGYFIYSIPADFISASQEAESTFVHNRGLLRGLFRAARNPPISPERFAGPDFTQMKTSVEGFLATDQILDTQKGAFTPVNKPLPNAKVPGAIRQEGMAFELKKLNLKQVVALSEQLSSMHPNTKLAAVEINADKEDPHYFNVKYTLSSLSLPMKMEKLPAKKTKEFKKMK